ncbi:hypothetical protein HH205_07135 [Streptococcus pneumoniae]|nr:hypothetical protein HH205_07135 [Streptococcus pneumoniae]
MTRFEEIFEEYKNPQDTFFYPLVYKENTYEKNCYFYLCSPNVRSLVQYYANDQNLPSRITYSEYSDK